MKQLIYIICGLYAISSYGQIPREVVATFDLYQVAMLELYPNNSTVTLNLSSAIEAGEKAAVVTTNNDKWINFSSAVFAGNSRSISIQMELGQKAPSGINLKLNTVKYLGSGNGELGSVTSVDAILNDQPQTIISGIKGAYTGSGINNGYKLTYSLEIYDYKLLDFNQTATLSITLTFYDE